MKDAIYPGSFDPWTLGHQFVLDSALKVFEKIYVLIAMNPFKSGTLDPLVRARLIAHAIDPLTDWWSKNPPFHVYDKVIVGYHGGLIVEYAAEKGISHLIRGLRSTTDFESEFNLYFSNIAINPSIQTWAIMCPPELLHCSSTFVKIVTGKESAMLIGTSFVSQATLLGLPKEVAWILDLIERISIQSFVKNHKEFRENLQKIFNTINKEIKNVSFKNLQTNPVQEFIIRHGEYLLSIHKNPIYLEDMTKELWRLLNNYLKENYLVDIKKVIDECSTIKIGP